MKISSLFSYTFLSQSQRVGNYFFQIDCIVNEYKCMYVLQRRINETKWQHCVFSVPPMQTYFILFVFDHDIKPNKRSILAKKKLITTSFFDINRSDDQGISKKNFILLIPFTCTLSWVQKLGVHGLFGNSLESSQSAQGQPPFYTYMQV